MALEPEADFDACNSDKENVPPRKNRATAVPVHLQDESESELDWEEEGGDGDFINDDEFDFMAPAAARSVLRFSDYC